MIARLKKLFGLKVLPDDMSYVDARAVLEKENRKVRRELAGRTDAPPEMLYYLSDDERVDVRVAVASNPSTPIKASEKLADDPNDDVRSELARRIANLVPSADASIQAGLRYQVIALLEKLAEDKLPRVRAIIAEEIRSSPDVPAHIVKKLAHDSEIAVCGPILEYSPLLSDADLMELIAGSAVNGAVEAVANRSHVSSDLADAVALSQDIPAVTALLSNPNAQIREETLDRIIALAIDVDALHQPLVSRPNLSMRAVRHIASFVARALLEQLLETSELDAETQKQVREKVLERIETDDAEAAKQDTKLANVRKAYKAGKLDDKAIMKLADSGGTDAIILALSLLVQESVGKVKAVADSYSAEAITAVCWQAGLSMRTAHTVQKALHVPYNKLLLPKGGFDYPLDEKKMIWQLEFSGFSNIEQA